VFFHCYFTKYYSSE